jgi:hypothetical protein
MGLWAGADPTMAVYTAGLGSHPTTRTEPLASWVATLDQVETARTMDGP